MNLGSKIGILSTRSHRQTSKIRSHQQSKIQRTLLQYRSTLTMLFYHTLVLATLPLSVAATTGWALESGSASCSGGFTLESLDFVCDTDDGICSLGEDLGMTGSCKYCVDPSKSDMEHSWVASLTLLSSVAFVVSTTTGLPTNANVTLQACVWTFICYSYTFSDVSLCDAMGLESVDGSSECPDAGDYSFASYLSIPGDDEWDLSWFSGYTFDLAATIEDTAGYAPSTSCSAKVSTATSTDESDSSAYQMATAFAAFSLFAVAVFTRRRKVSFANEPLLYQGGPQHDVTARSKP